MWMKMRESAENDEMILGMGKSNKKSLRAVFTNQNDNVDEDA